GLSGRGGGGGGGAEQRVLGLGREPSCGPRGGETYERRRYPTPQSLTTTSCAPAASSLRRNREAWESSVLVRIAEVRMPHTSRSSSLFVKTRLGSLASLAASSNSWPERRTAT